jgi:probable phosphomutase (TIGR03848 family)
VPTVLLVRHGRTAANTGGVLAGWSPGVGLDETGRGQAVGLAARLAVLPLAPGGASPQPRGLESAAELLAGPGPGDAARPALVVDDRLGECRYGDWTGRALKDLAKDPLWRAVQVHPSSVIFPGDGGESMLTMQQRTVTALREHDARVAAAAGEHAVWVAVSHGDPIKAALADALGMHLDQFQRIVVDPGSVSVVRYTPLRPFVLRVNDSSGDLTPFLPPPPQPRRRGSRRSAAATEAAAASDAVVGGPAGPPTGTGAEKP